MPVEYCNEKLASSTWDNIFYLKLFKTFMCTRSSVEAERQGPWASCLKLHSRVVLQNKSFEPPPPRHPHPHPPPHSDVCAKEFKNVKFQNMYTICANTVHGSVLEYVYNLCKYCLRKCPWICIQFVQILSTEVSLKFWRLRSYLTTIIQYTHVSEATNRIIK